MIGYGWKPLVAQYQQAPQELNSAQVDMVDGTCRSTLRHAKVQMRCINAYLDMYNKYIVLGI